MPETQDFTPETPVAELPVLVRERRGTQLDQWIADVQTTGPPELRGFSRVTLDPGQSTSVRFTLGPDELSLIDRRMQRVVEPGRFDVMVGTSANTTLAATLDVR